MHWLSWELSKSFYFPVQRARISFRSTIRSLQISPSFFINQSISWKYLGDSVFKPSVICAIPILRNTLIFALSGRMLTFFFACLKIICMLHLLSAKFHIYLLDHAFSLSHTHSRQKGGGPPSHLTTFKKSF